MFIYTNVLITRYYMYFVTRKITLGLLKRATFSLFFFFFVINHYYLYKSRLFFHSFFHLSCSAFHFMVSIHSSYSPELTFDFREPENVIECENCALNYSLASVFWNSVLDILFAKKSSPLKRLEPI